MERKNLYSGINKVFMITYFFLLILVQIIGILLIITYHKVIGIGVMIVISVIITLIWPIILSFILRKLFSYLAKVREAKLYKE